MSGLPAYAGVTLTFRSSSSGPKKAFVSTLNEPQSPLDTGLGIVENGLILVQQPLTLTAAGAQGYALTVAKWKRPCCNQISHW